MFEQTIDRTNVRIYNLNCSKQKMQTSDSNGVGAPFYLTALHNNSVEHTMGSTCVQLDNYIT